MAWHGAYAALPQMSAADSNVNYSSLKRCIAWWQVPFFLEFKVVNIFTEKWHN